MPVPPDKKRLELLVVIPVDQRNRNFGVRGQGHSAFQTGEAAANNHDMRRPGLLSIRGIHCFMRP